MSISTVHPASRVAACSHPWGPPRQQAEVASHPASPSARDHALIVRGRFRTVARQRPSAAGRAPRADDIQMRGPSFVQHVHELRTRSPELVHHVHEARMRSPDLVHHVHEARMRSPDVVHRLSEHEAPTAESVQRVHDLLIAAGARCDGSADRKLPTSWQLVFS